MKHKNRKTKNADAWQAIPEAQIIDSFKEYWLTNAVDGSEDDLISVFKVSHPCAAGRALLQVQHNAFSLGNLEAEESELKSEENAIEKSDGENDEIFVDDEY